MRICSKNKIKKIAKKLTFLFFLIFFLFSSFSSVVFSQTTTGNSGGANTGAESKTKTVSLDNPLKTDTIPGLIGSITTTLLSIIGSLALLAFVVGGVRWLISGGKPEQIKKGANTMLYAIIGLFVVFGSYAILKLIIGTITGGG